MLLFSRHVRKRMLERGITVDEIQAALGASTIVEDYPDETPYPSRLVLGWVESRPLHVADDRDGERTIVVTAYEPDPARWEEGWTRRKA